MRSVCFHLCSHGIREFARWRLLPQSEKAHVRDFESPSHHEFQVGKHSRGETPGPVEDFPIECGPLQHEYHERVVQHSDDGHVHMRSYERVVEAITGVISVVVIVWVLGEGPVEIESFSLHEQPILLEVSQKSQH